jgi:menaquinone-dependent protoporphyrinogen oxidase
MRVLVTWGSKRGGTEGIARILADALRRDGIEVEARPPDQVDTLAGFDAAIVGGALYANRWHRAARRFVRRHVAELRRIPVWCFSSGPLDASADDGAIAPTGQVTALMARIGARGHVTFGGRLTPDASGFPASAMAKKNSGDWRNPARIRAWADELAVALPSAQPGHAVDPPSRSWSRWALYALLVAGLAACARLALLALGTGGGMVALHAIVTMVLAAVVARLYFRPRGAREPLPTAALFAATTLVLDAFVLRRALAEPVGITAALVTFVAAFLTVWATGGVLSTMPWPKPAAVRHAA